MDTKMSERRKKLTKIINDYILIVHWGDNDIPIDMASTKKDDLMQGILALIEQEVAEAKRKLRCKLTGVELHQLKVYVQWAEQGGDYYGNQKYFKVRHESIKRWLAELQEEKD
jgi:hypothetical protein